MSDTNLSIFFLCFLIGSKCNILWTMIARNERLFFSASVTRNWINIKLVHKNFWINLAPATCKLLQPCAQEQTRRLIKRITVSWAHIAQVGNHHCSREKQKEKHCNYDNPHGRLGIHFMAVKDAELTRHYFCNIFNYVLYKEQYSQDAELTRHYFCNIFNYILYEEQYSQVK